MSAPAVTVAEVLQAIGKQAFGLPTVPKGLSADLRRKVLVFLAIPEDPAHRDINDRHLFLHVCPEAPEWKAADILDRLAADHGDLVKKLRNEATRRETYTLDAAGARKAVRDLERVGLLCAMAAEVLDT